MDRRDYHIPVLLQATVDGLAPQENGVYVDATFGGGGHSKELLARKEGIRVVAFDKDPDAKANAEALGTENITLVAADFRHLHKYLRLYGHKHVDGVMADLGVSSHQIDQGSRGFSTRADGPLNMRMDQSKEFAADHVLNQYEPKQLQRMLSAYGEVRNAKTLAEAIAAHRINQPFETTGQLVALAQTLAPRGKENRYLAQVFQAIRIEVNQEMQGLQEFLVACAKVLKPGGRLSVISYHSLEDRLVKRFVRNGNFEGEPKKDLYGKPIKPFEPVNRKPIVADEEELAQNPRARSAKLRIAQRNQEPFDENLLT